MDNARYHKFCSTKKRIHELECMERSLKESTPLYISPASCKGQEISQDMRKVLWGYVCQRD